MRRLVMLVGLAVGSIAIGSVPWASAQSADGWTITLGQSSVEYGDQLQVRGTGLPAGALLHIELCGNAGLDATVDCDVRGATEYAVRSAGELFAVVGVRPLPKPCPCVVRITSSSLSAEILEPIEIPQAGFVEAERRVADAGVSRPWRITSVEVAGGGAAAFFGLPHSRAVHIEILNGGDSTAQVPTLVVKVGEGASPSGVLDVPEIAPLAPGESARVSIEAPVSLLALGDQSLVASLHGIGDPIVTRASFGSYPWGAIAVGLVTLQFGLLRLRNRVRRRVARRVGELDPRPPDAVRQTEPREIVVPIAEASVAGDLGSESVSPGGEPAEARLDGQLTSVGERNEPTGGQPDSALPLLADTPTGAKRDEEEMRFAVDRVSRVVETTERGISDAQAEVERMLSDLLARVQSVAEKGEASLELVLQRIHDARVRNDELAEISRREIAAARADLEELRRAGATEYEAMREDAAEALQLIRQQLDSRVSSTLLVMEQALAAAEVQASSHPWGPAHGSAGGESADVIDMRSRDHLVRRVRVTAEALPGDAFATAIHRAVRRSLTQ